MTNYLCLDCDHDFTLIEGANAPKQCPVRTCRSYEVISYDELNRALSLTNHYIETTVLGIIPTLDAISAIFSEVGIRRFKIENTMKLVKMILDRLKATGEVTFCDISVDNDVQQRSING